jgi:hypothetical protein
MTTKQIDLYLKLRNRLRSRGIKNIPTALKIHEISNQKGFMIIKVLSEEIKNMDAWEHSKSFRQVCFNKHGSDFNIYKTVENEIKKVLEYAE